MKVLIIEDENPAAHKLIRYLERYDPKIEVLATLASIHDSVNWLKEHQEETDLIFMDIELIDGRSFAIFSQLEVTRPVIFITAYDDYAIQAFKVNSVDYLLKPLTYQDLEKSLQKFSQLKSQFGSGEESSSMQKLMEHLQQGGQSYKDRFMVKLGDHIRSVLTREIDLFYAEGRIVYLITGENKKYIVDYRLEDLEQLLDPRRFFRCNRSYIVNIDAIRDAIVYSNSRLKIVTGHALDKDIIVSREKVNDFKGWFDGK